MRTIRAWRALLLGVGLFLAGVAIAGCDQMEPIDQNFDSSLGADFRAPADAAPDGGATDASDAAATATP
ncbi:MAG TPA: hypothetical protein VGP64_10940 [Polyangia bacterium]|jgi:hypothetical protein